MPEPISTEQKLPLRATVSVIAVLAVGAVVAFALFQKPEPTPQPQTPAPVATASATAMAAAPVFTATRPGPPPKASASSSPDMDAETPAWEKQIENTLSVSTDEAQTAQALLNLLPTLPEEGQIEAANHIANLLPDEKYALVKPVLLNPAMPETVLSVFFTDLMNREDGLKLRTFLDIAKVPNHPFHEEALSDLQIYIGDDHGTDWTKWNAAVEQYLKTSAADQ